MTGLAIFFKPGHHFFESFSNLCGGIDLFDVGHRQANDGRQEMGRGGGDDFEAEKRM